MRHMGVYGRLAVGAGAIALALLTGAGPALAASSPISFSDADGPVPAGSTITANTTLTVSGHVGATTGQTSLQVYVPGDSSPHTVDTGSGIGTLNGTTLVYHLNTTCLQYTNASTCSGLPAPNGDYSFKLVGGENYCCGTLTLQIPPAQVQGVTASANGSQLTMSWQPGAEPDLVAYDILSASDQPVVSGISPSNACSGGTCGAVVNMGPQWTGSQSFVVRSERSTCPGCASTLSSPDSQPATVTFPTPSPSPSPSSSGGGSGAKSSGGSHTAKHPGATAAGPDVHAALPPAMGGGPVAAPFSNGFVPPVYAAQPQAPALPGGSADALGPVNGGYSPVLAYPSQGLTQQQSTRPTVRTTRHATALTARLTANTTTLWKSAAGCLLLVLLAGHLRAWVGRPNGD